MNKGRHMNENSIMKIFKALGPSSLNMKVNRIKKIKISAMETITLSPSFEKNFKSNTRRIRKTDEINRRLDLAISITTLKFQ
jgi:hypothetical protein